MKTKLGLLLALFFLILADIGLFAQKSGSGYTFSNEKRLPASPVKNQYRSGTCWSFASVSFLESELLRTGKGMYDLSEMFLVHNCYGEKADKYVRMHGKTNFGPGGLTGDMLAIWKDYGLLPEEAYSGLVIGEENHIHGEMDEVLKDYVDGVIKNENNKLTPVWKKGFDLLVDTYLGYYPEEFTYNGKNYTPKSFAADLGLDPDDYVMITSFTHHPFYSSFILEIPDNWRWSEMYNVPLDEMMQIADNALKNGYTVSWDADVSEKGFNWNLGLALMPSEEIMFLSNLEQARWSELSPKEKQSLIYDFSTPKKEMFISQEIRQKAFDNYTTTDDHLMHIIGTAQDQNGTPFYIVKNSWGTDGHVYDGYFYASLPYLQSKTLFFMVHKDAVPAPIARKLGLKK
ncbi:MAG: aminopeptidase C [Bacteroidota bacterium]